MALRATASATGPSIPPRAVARRLARSDDAAARWVGADALRELTSRGVSKRLA